MNSATIQRELHKNFVAPDLSMNEAVKETFRNVMRAVDREAALNPPKNSAELVERIENASILWEEAMHKFNELLMSLNSTEVIDVSCFKPLLREELPEFYSGLLILGLKPLDDEKEVVKKFLEERKKNHNG